jgi:uridine kinase
MTVDVFCKNMDAPIVVPYGSTLKEIAEQNNIKNGLPFLGGLVNNKVRSLSYRVHKPSVIEFFDMSSTYGIEMYTRSLFFVLYKAIHDLYPLAIVHVLHSISGGKYCELENLPVQLNTDIVAKIQHRMNLIVEANYPLIRREVLSEKAFQERTFFDTDTEMDIFLDRNKFFTTVYELDNVVNYYYSHLLPSTGYLKLFSLELYETGLLLKVPHRKRPTSIPQTRKMPKLFTVYKQFKEWGKRIGVPYISDLNKRIEKKDIGDLILTTEALQEKIWANTADEIMKRGTKMVLISGPSSSGKTTSCKRLSVQLSVLGYHPVQISVDDFFVERTETPLDEHGNYDFEALEAIDLKLFNNTLLSLLHGEEVEIPRFNFTLGTKEWVGHKLKMQPNSILVVEGIHCLNPKLTELVEDSTKYMIFVSALTSLSIDKMNPIPTTDNRLIRRIIRDYNYRGYSAVNTLNRWPSVRNGEEKNIFPYQENADMMFNTSLVYELGVLKPYALPILLEVPETSPEYAEAARLLNFLSYFKPIPDELIPGTSILREFVGGSKFSY